MNRPYQESAACPIDHDELEREAFEAGEKHERSKKVKDSMNDWFSSKGGKAITALCTAGVFLIIVLFIARSWPKDPVPPAPACQEFRIDTTMAACTGGTVEPVGGYLVCKCPHTEKTDAKP